MAEAARSARSGDGDPATEIAAYIDRKLEMSRDNPKASRLFAMEIIQGAPMLGDVLAGRLKRLVDEKAAVIRALDRRRARWRRSTRTTSSS